MRLVSVNPNGNMIGLNFVMAFGVKTSVIGRGIYAMISNCEGVHFVSPLYIKKEIERETYQLPMPEFGV